MKQNDKNRLNLQTSVTDEAALDSRYIIDPRYIINDAGEMQIIEFSVVPRRANE